LPNKSAGVSRHADVAPAVKKHLLNCVVQQITGAADVTKKAVPLQRMLAKIPLNQAKTLGFRL